MFPTFQYLIDYLLGINIPGLSIVKTFGFFVAVSFIAAAFVIRKELQRYAATGIFKGEDGVEIINKPVKLKDYAINGLLGFLLGYKLVGLLGAGQAASEDPMNYIMSGKGNIMFGIVFMLLFAVLKFIEAQKVKGKTQTERKVKIFPHDRVADILLIGAVGGFAGAKIFNAFETWDDFVKSPLESLFSGSGLTFYGGLIVATIALYYYAKKKKFSFVRLCDAVAPALILAYGIGRLGCHFAGDGDWGIYNSAYITQADGTLVEAQPGEFEEFVAQNPNLFAEFRGNVPHKYAPAPTAIPRWIYAQNYPHNVNREGFAIKGYEGSFPTVLPASVFPTPIYEFFACMLIFAFLMWIRKRQKWPLQLFGIYLIFNGLERFLVEKIRVNHKYDWGFLQPTQAEIISFAFIIIGLYLWLMNPYKKKKTHLPH